ncbi:hypothetical protein HK101_007017 [Irineochytrium annulatum]|nr:hypothetical protein HK101_007017 [Irineochytrium annulatum]
MDMPVLDGCGATRVIRKFEADNGIAEILPIVAVTGNAGKTWADMAAEAGMQRVLLKPFSREGLHQVLLDCAKLRVVTKEDSAIDSLSATDREHEQEK